MDSKQLLEIIETKENFGNFLRPIASKLQSNLRS